MARKMDGGWIASSPITERERNYATTFNPKEERLQSDIAELEDRCSRLNGELTDLRRQLREAKQIDPEELSKYKRDLERVVRDAIEANPTEETVAAITNALGVDVAYDPNGGIYRRQVPDTLALTIMCRYLNRGPIIIESEKSYVSENQECIAIPNEIEKGKLSRAVSYVGRGFLTFGRSIKVLMTSPKPKEQKARAKRKPRYMPRTW